MTDVTCTNCKHTFNVEPLITVPDEQRMSIEITAEGEYFSAKSFGGIVVETAKLMSAVAKEVGCKVETMIESITKEGNKLQVGFVIIRTASGKEIKP